MHALRALTEVIQDANHDNGIKTWVVCPRFAGTGMGDVIPGTNATTISTSTRLPAWSSA